MKAAQRATVALLRHGGSHLIRPIVADLGFEIIEPGNFGAAPYEAQGPVIVWLRDPRDRMAATWRWWLRKPRKCALMSRGGDDPDSQLAWLLDDDGGGFMEHMLAWARVWPSWPGACTARFEAMRYAGPQEISRIASHLGVECDAGALHAKIWQEPSSADWRASFGPRSTAAWDALGGAELLRIMGYA